LETFQTEKESREKQLDTLHSEKEGLAQELESTLVKNALLTETLEISHKEKEDLDKQLQATQAEMDQRIASESDDLTRELAAMSVEVKELKEKLDSTYLEYKESVKEESEKIGIMGLPFDHDTPTIIDSQNEEPDEADEDITFSMLSSAIDFERDDEAVAQQNPERINTIDLSFDHDTTEIADSPTEEPAINNDADEDITFSILNPAKDIETEAAEDDAGEGNQDTDSLPGDQETNHSDVILLQTILKAAKGFRSINQRLHKIAEARLTPSANNGDSKGKDTRDI
jgi:hypothetical protein